MADKLDDLMDTIERMTTIMDGMKEARAYGTQRKRKDCSPSVGADGEQSH